MKWGTYALALLVASLAPFVVPCALADDFALPISKSPVAVQDTVKKLLGHKTALAFDPGDLLGQKSYILCYEEEDTFILHTVLIGESGAVVEMDVDTPKTKVPAPVMDTVARLHPQPTLSDTMTGTRDGKSFYVIELVDNLNGRELKINADGKLISDLVTQVSIPPGKAPAAISDAARKAHPDGTIQDVEWMRGNEQVIYTVVMLVGKDNRFVEIDADGALYSDAVGSTNIDKDKLPAAIVSAINLAEPKAVIQDASTQNINGKLLYQIDASVGADSHSIKITADGKIVDDSLN